MKLKLPVKFFLIFSLLLAGCGPDKYNDVSHHQQFKKILGSEYITLVDLVVIGVTFNANYKKNVDYVYLVKKPGFGGPEVVFSEDLNKGSRIKIVGAFASDSWFTTETFYRVEIIGSKQYEKFIVLIYDTGGIENQNMGIDEAVFKKL